LTSGLTHAGPAASFLSARAFRPTVALAGAMVRIR
jgi:hypothetical protein